MTPYSGMLPGFVAGHYTYEECHIDLSRLCEFSKVHLIHCEANKIDMREKKVWCSDGRPPIPYDVLSIDIGISPSINVSLPDGFEVDELLVPVKPIDKFTKRFDSILGSIMNNEEGESKSRRVVVVGGGAGGTELAMSLSYRLEVESEHPISMILVHRGPALLQSHNKKVQEKVLRICTQERGVDVMLDTDIVRVEVREGGQKVLVGKTVKEEEGKSEEDVCFDIEFDDCIWCTMASSQSWIKDIDGLELNEEGFICVENTLQVFLP